MQARKAQVSAALTAALLVTLFRAPTVHAEVTPDLTPPVTVLSIQPAVPDGLSGWYRSQPILDFAVDEAASTYFSWEVPVSSWTVFSVPLAAPAGERRITFLSRDLAGNSEAEQSADIKFDPDPPSGGLTFAERRLGSVWYVRDPRLRATVSAADGGGSGVAASRSYVDGSSAVASWRDFTTLQDVRLPEHDGLHRVTVELRDAAGNATALPAASVFLDRLPPRPYLSAPRMSRPFRAGRHKGKSKVPVSVHPRDATPSSGIDSYSLQYRRGVQGTWKNLGTVAGAAPARFWGRAGATYYLRARVRDNSGNVSAPSPARRVFIRHLPGKGKVFRSAPRMQARQKKVVALTFDDGPSPYTREVLAVLRRNRAKATFFVLGAQARSHPRLVRQIIRDGHGIGNHTVHHRFLTHLSPREAHLEIGGASRAIERFGVDTKWLRPPYGAVSTGVRKAAAREGLDVVLWDIDPWDWSGKSAGAITSHVTRRAHPGAIILLHDGGGDRSETVRALPRIIKALKRRGYTFVTVDDLLG